MLFNSFKWKHYEGEIILLNVRWYLKYPLSYRNLKKMMIERGIQVDHRIPLQKYYFCNLTLQFSPLGIIFARIKIIKFQNCDDF